MLLIEKINLDKNNIYSLERYKQRINDQSMSKSYISISKKTSYIQSSFKQSKSKKMNNDIQEIKNIMKKQISSKEQNDEY